MSALGATVEVDEGGGRRGRDGSEVVSRESPVVIVVIKWRLAGGFVSVVCIRRDSEGNTGREIARDEKGEETKETEGEKEKERAEGSCS